MSAPVTSSTFSKPVTDPDVQGVLDARYRRNGVASTLADLPPGLPFYVLKVGANWTYNGVTITSRPSARTDIIMVARSTDGSVPSFAVADLDEVKTVPA